MFDVSVVASWKEYANSLPTMVQSEIDLLSAEGKKTAAIVEIRRRLGVDLPDAKRMIDLCELGCSEPSRFLRPLREIIAAGKVYKARCDKANSPKFPTEMTEDLRDDLTTALIGAMNLSYDDSNGPWGNECHFCMGRSTHGPGNFEHDKDCEGQILINRLSALMLDDEVSGVES